MKDESVIQLFRLGCGTALLIAHAFTDVNGMLVTSAMLLIGLPYEVIVSYAKTKKET